MKTETEIIKKILQKTADELKEKYPDIEFFLYTDNHSKSITIAIFKSFLSYVGFSQRIQARVINAFTKEEEKYILDNDDKQFIFKHK